MSTSFEINAKYNYVMNMDHSANKNTIVFNIGLKKLHATLAMIKCYSN